MENTWIFPDGYTRLDYARLVVAIGVVFHLYRNDGFDNMLLTHERVMMLIRAARAERVRRGLEIE